VEVLEPKELRKSIKEIVKSLLINTNSSIMQHIIVPDVHGRKFWKDIKRYENVPCVFLGDYIDPYYHEGITSLESINVFLQIVDYAKSHDNVQLLIGNHDLEYAISLGASRCRYDYENADNIKKIFNENADLFDVAYEFYVGEKRFFCTHAGIHPHWCLDNSDVFGERFADAFHADKLNKMFHDRDKRFVESLRCVGWGRGGRNSVGSLVWCDAREFLDGYMARPDDYTVQVVGHTQLKEPILEEDSRGILFLDARRCFYVDDEGKISVLSP
jgi:hypothetical protein